MAQGSQREDHTHIPVLDVAVACDPNQTPNVKASGVTPRRQQWFFEKQKKQRRVLRKIFKKMAPCSASTLCLVELAPTQYWKPGISVICPTACRIPCHSVPDVAVVVIQVRSQMACTSLKTLGVSPRRQQRILCTLFRKIASVSSLRLAELSPAQYLNRLGSLSLPRRMPHIRCVGEEKQKKMSPYWPAISRTDDGG